MSAPDLSAHVEELMLAFENAAANTRVPDVEPFLPPPGDPARLEAVRELARVSLELRWVRGERPDPIEYVARYPELSDPSALAAVCFEDYRQRLLAGEMASRESYRERFGINVSDWPMPGAATARRGPTSFVTPLPVADTPTEQLRVRESISPPPRRSIDQGFPEPGEVFAGFRLVSEIGRGAFGRVYLAEQVDLANRRMALKVSTRLASEVRTLARLQHTNIVPVYSAHQVPPFTASCMPFFGGTTLATLLAELTRVEQLDSGKIIADIVRKESTEDWRDRPPSAAMSALASTTYIDAVLWVGERLADALAHAHERGIIHRDIKPANILLADDGQPMLLDFNLAEDGNESAADRARVGGTLPYMAPEHMHAFAGGSLKVDARADIYSLGAVLYQLLTRRLPYPDRIGDTEVVLTQMQADRSGTIPLVRPFNPDISPAVEAIVRKCLELDPDKRYSSAAALRDDIARHRAHLPLQAIREPSYRERASKWICRNAWITSAPALATYVAAALLLMAAVTVRLSLDARMKRQDMERTQAYRELDEFLKLSERVKIAAGSPSDLNEVARLGTEALHRYRATNSGWEKSERVTRLRLEDRARLKSEMGEVAFLTARAAFQSKRDAYLADRLNAIASDTVAPDAKEAVAAQRSELTGVAPDEIPKAMGEGGRGDYLRACDLAARGRFIDALPIIDRFVVRNPDDFGGWYMKARCHDVLGQYDEAHAAYSASAALRPTSPYPVAARGDLTLRHGKDKHQARADLDRALQLDPHHFEARITRAIVLRNLRLYRESLSDLDLLIEQGNAPTRVYFIRSQVRAMAGDRKGAEADRAEGMRLEPKDPASYVTRGLARAMREPEAALADFRAAEKLDPLYSRALINQAWLLGDRMNRTEEAIAVTNRLLEMYPDDLNGRCGRAVLLARLGRTEEAIAEARKSLSKAPHPMAQYKAGCVFAVVARKDRRYREEGLRLVAMALMRGYGHQDLLTDDDLSALKGDERFQKIFEAVKVMKDLGAKK